MAIPSNLAYQIQSSIENKMSQVSGSEIKNVEFQIELGKALAKAWTTVITGQAQGTGGPGFIAIGSTIGLELDQSMITGIAFSDFKSSAPKATNYCKEFFDAIAETLVKSAKLLEITSISGFGGAVSSVVFPGDAFSELAYSSMPSKMKKGEFLSKILKSLGKGIQTAMLTATSKMVPNAPVGSPPAVGPLLAKFS